MGRELFRLADRHGKDYCLGPTHEEAVTDLVAAQTNLSYRQLPLRLYQVTRKFRDEPKPRFGLLRGREFYMKDMYTFDASEEAARHTYSLVCDAYRRVFEALGLRFVQVQADTGSIGGTMSHEFQLPADIGEDRLVLCPTGHFAANVETISAEQTTCPTCGEPLTPTRGIEVGHTFYLGTKYSSVFNATFYSAENKLQLAEMGCYGLGVTRILAAAVEVLSTEDSIRWPSLIAPYQVCFIPPKKGSKEEKGAVLMEHLYDDLAEAVPQLDIQGLVPAMMKSLQGVDGRLVVEALANVGNILSGLDRAGYTSCITRPLRFLFDDIVLCQGRGNEELLQNRRWP
nr:PREDICTED: probable proline--tRNA ligase, mitochondrial [Apteryx mantelli mantelli]